MARPAPWLSEEEIEEAKRRNSRSRFNRLFHGVWGSGSGDALDQEDIDAAVLQDLGPQRQAQPGWFYFAGMDLGIKHDHSAIVVIGARTDMQKMRLVETHQFRPESVDGGKPIVDLRKVERTVVDVHRRFRPRQVTYDPWQAALMAARCSQLGVTMKEMTFSGKNLNMMATTMLEVFRSHRIELYNQPALIADLAKLTIVEKSYGHRLEATRDASGHADLATALAIVLPVVAKKLEGPAFLGGGIDYVTGSGLSPYEEYLEREQHEPEDHQEGFKEMMGMTPRAIGAMFNRIYE